MITAQVINSILELSPEDWGRIAPPDFPFSGYHFLAALETTDCLGARTGWVPRIVIAREGLRLRGAVILYLKSNSYGEYIFDFAWAEAYQRTGLSYYPKLTSAIPFTPATGPKLLVDPELSDQEQNDICNVLLAEVDQLAEKSGVSSTHALFIPAAQVPVYAQSEYFIRDSFQFHWHNHAYSDFADFLATLRSKRRREILRERAQVSSAPVKILRLTGNSLTPDHGEIFYRFYLSTIDKRSSFNYLTRDFFKTVFKTMSAQILLVLAVDAHGEPVAGALNYFGTQTLYGRNWGCTDEYRALHFELCYYQGLEFAIERQFKTFEAGAQGEHKFQRGFLPTLTYSAHKIVHPMLGEAIRNHVQHEREQIQEALLEYQSHTPYSREE